jgi:hypothetical protein
MRMFRLPAPQTCRRSGRSGTANRPLTHAPLGQQRQGEARRKTGTNRPQEDENGEHRTVVGELVGQWPRWKPTRMW